MSTIQKLFPVILFFSLGLVLQAQDAVSEVFGQITDEEGEVLQSISVSYNSPDGMKGSVSDENGNFRLEVERGKSILLTVRGTSYKSQEFKLTVYGPRQLDVVLQSDLFTIEELKVTSQRSQAAGIYTIDPKSIESVPSVGNPVITLIKSLPGVSSSSELSSSYSVRGGNFDENLIYVNGFEINRPFLIRSGQQEGLNFINPDLVSNVSFSPGGFEAKYGDKLSSVLDVQYKRPREFAGSASMSLLGAAAHLEGVSKNQNLSYIFGFRQKSNQYLLNSLPTQGQYFPLFVDMQAFLTYDLNTNFQLQYISNYSNNRYLFIPESENIRFGTFSTAQNIRIAFEGQEKDTYTSSMNGLGLNYTSDDKKLNLKALTSFYQTSEREAFDIIGSYFIGDVESNLGESDFGEVTRERGIGTYQNFARNELSANIYNGAIRGIYDTGKHLWQFGLKYQHEDINDQINEWERRDSAGHSLPFNESQVLLWETLKSNIDLSSNRYMGFVQNNWEVGAAKRGLLTAGARFNYWDLNKEFLVSPRLQFKLNPKLKTEEEVDEVSEEGELPKKSSKFDPDRRWSFRLATGLYHQPPFYRELRNRQGEINTGLKAQKSWHFVLGGDYDFLMWNRPFKFTTELYYKALWDLVSYEVDNVLIRYSGQNDAKGYAVGADFRVYGEFVENVDSWFSLSLLKTQEDLNNDDYIAYFNAAGEEVLPQYVNPNEIVDSTFVEKGLIDRPTDQRANFSIFFQDYLPGNENIQVNLNLLFGTPFKFSPPGFPRLRNAFNTSIYFRTDIGFSAQLYKRGRREVPEFSLLNKMESVWASLEVFNLLGVANTVSYSWIYDFDGRVYAVNNKLTSRRVNLRFIIKF